MPLEILSFQEAEQQEKDGLIKLICSTNFSCNSKNLYVKIIEQAVKWKADTIARDLNQKISDPPKNSKIFAKFYKRNEADYIRKETNFDYQMAMAC